MGAFAYRMLGALSLDSSTYEALEADRTATGQAFLVVLLSSVAAGVGAGGWDGPGVAMLIVMSVAALVTWVAWVVLILVIGGRYLPERQTRVTARELLRTVGFAASPGLLQVFGIIPTLTVPVFVGTWLWMLAAMVVAVRQALDFSSTARAALTCATALVLIVAVAFVLALAIAPTVS